MNIYEILLSHAIFLTPVIIVGGSYIVSSIRHYNIVQYAAICVGIMYSILLLFFVYEIRYTLLEPVYYGGILNTSDYIAITLFAVMVLLLVIGTIKSIIQKAWYPLMSACKYTGYMFTIVCTLSWIYLVLYIQGITIIVDTF